MMMEEHKMVEEKRNKMKAEHDQMLREHNEASEEE
jgi:hypothetical protein